MSDEHDLDDFGLFDEWGPEKVICVADRRTRMRGVLVIDNTARGMGKGGTRMTPTVSVGEIARLARVMTWKWAAVDLFYGGAKAGIRADPAHVDKEAVLRAFVRRLANEVPSEYVFGLDMGLTECDAAIIQDELGDRGAAVGTPRARGGVPYDEWGVTGFGVAEAADAAAKDRDGSLAGSTAIVQGFGAVGAAAARRLVDLGCRVVAISTVDGGLYDADGLDVEMAIAARDDQGDGFLLELSGQQIRPGAELELSADLLVPAASQDLIDEKVAVRLRVSLIVEGANLPTTPRAREILFERGIRVVPDFIANAGGVIAAAFAMESRYSAFPAAREEILEEISTRLRTNTRRVLQASAAQRVTPHTAAYRLAADRVRAAMSSTEHYVRPTAS